MPQSSQRRPAWIAPRYPANARKNTTTHAAFLAVRRNIGDYSEGSPHRQCTATAKHTGERCRNICVKFSDKCRFHGGTVGREEKAKAVFGCDIVIVPKDRGAQRRKHLRSLGEPSSWANYLDQGGIDFKVETYKDRGEIVEAWQNKETDPETWRRVVSKYHK